TPFTARRTPSLLKNNMVCLPEATAALATTIATVARSGSSIERVRLIPKLFNMLCLVLSVEEIDGQKNREVSAAMYCRSFDTRQQYRQQRRGHRRSPAVSVRVAVHSWQA